MLKNLLRSRLTAAFVCLFILTVAQRATAQETNMFVRAGGGLTMSSETIFTDADCNSTDPAAFFGCSAGNDGKSIGARGEFSESVLLELGIGYRFNDWLEAEFQLAYRPDMDFEGTSNFNQLSVDFNQEVSAEGKSLSAMFVGIVRPLALTSMASFPVKPLILAGLGIAHNTIDQVTFTFPSTSTITPKGSTTGFAWTVGVGLSYEISKSLELQCIYRYFDPGKITTDVGTMTITRNSTSAIITDSIVINKIEADPEFNEILLSLIYRF